MTIQQVNFFERSVRLRSQYRYGQRRSVRIPPRRLLLPTLSTYIHHPLLHKWHPRAPNRPQPHLHPQQVLLSSPYGRRTKTPPPRASRPSTHSSSSSCSGASRSSCIASSLLTTLSTLSCPGEHFLRCVARSAGGKIAYVCWYVWNTLDSRVASDSSSSPPPCAHKRTPQTDPNSSKSLQNGWSISLSYITHTRTHFLCASFVLLLSY